MPRRKNTPPPPLDLRPCRPADLPKVLALWKRAGAAPSVTDDLGALKRRLRADRDLFLLAWDGRRLVGSVIGGFDGWRGSMARLAVLPSHRRHGVARQLVAAVERRLKARGTVRISGIVLRRNRKGRRFWEESGYRHDAESVRYIKDLG